MESLTRIVFRLFLGAIEFGASGGMIAVCVVGGGDGDDAVLGDEVRKGAGSRYSRQRVRFLVVFRILDPESCPRDQDRVRVGSSGPLAAPW